MTSLRIFFIGGAISFRALFGWLTPAIYIPTMILTPIFQIIFFAYIGRAAGGRSDEFYVIGNALQYAAVPCLFAMASTIADERFWQTLGPILISPARRLPLFLGRALPVIVNGLLTCAVSLLVGGLLLGVHFPGRVWVTLVPVLLAATFSCTGLGLITAAIGLRVRETAVLSNVFIGLLLVFCGANVPLDDLPGAMSSISRVLPLTHAIEAARDVAAGASLGSVDSLLGREVLIGVVYSALGFGLIRFLEQQSRRLATLERV
ncbi:MAG TPA: ABC transporter permease [Gaiellaceae bacterium]|jgi:ABC-2 type transport system permease protein|nr:ABC transporter permease [Gaiellaceae bacterium]